MLAGVSTLPQSASADAPDIRSVRPVVMLAVDTSGSMERRADCRCTTVACTECLPMCRRGSYQRNRWSMVLEALTGSFRTYTCTSTQRRDAFFRGQYDQGYYLPHIDLPLSAANQQNNGILDTYRDRIKFGLMTFDAIGTLTSRPPLVRASEYRGRSFLDDTFTAEGGFSYGEQRDFTFRGCDTTYMLDNGARRAGVHGGALISVGSESSYRDINANIQTTLLKEDEDTGQDLLRPHGATPIAGMLDDLRYYLSNNPDVRRVRGGEGDRYYSCRKRYGILLTDGMPNADMRGAPYHCDAPGFRCPYQTPEDIATALCGFSSRTSSCTGTLDGLFVVGFNIGGDAVTRLNALARAGGTTRAYFANDREGLSRRLGEVLDATAPGTTTRTMPSFSPLSGGGSGASGQMQFNTGFRTTTEDDEPWHGVLERRRFTCDGVDVVAQRISGRDRFHQVLNDRNISSDPRDLYTVIPRNRELLDEHLTSDVGETRVRRLGVPVPATGGVQQTGLSLEPLTLRNANLSTSHLYLDSLGSRASARREEIIRTLHGYPGTRRGDNRLGDIYHSSPVAHGAPNMDRADASYNLFRNKAEISTRPTVLYVGTNDGILHAFAAEDTTITREGGSRTTVRGGDELWGFVPPILLPKLESTLGAHQFMVDATPVVKEVFVGRLPGQAPNADEWRTVLVSALRGGGRGFFALDVSDPMNPEFLWQFANRNVGETYGQPAFGQVLMNIAGQDHERAVALLPGGTGTVIAGRECSVTGDARPSDAEPHRRARNSRRCWESGLGNGRYLAIVDVATGRTIREFDSSTFPAPLSGGVSVFAGQVGAIATRAFFTDADGVIWRLDMSNRDASRWTVKAMHDIYYDGAYNAAQPSYDAPILSTDTEGRVVIMAATGNVDRLDEYTAQNRVVSLTEKVNFNARGELSAPPTALLNWQIRLERGEQVTGPLELFGGKLYFATFKSTSDPTNACAFGFSRIYGAHYRDTRSDLAPAFGLESRAGSGVFDRLFIGPDSAVTLNNNIVLGVSVAKRPQCLQGSEVTEMDPFMGSRSQFRVQRTAAPSYQLVALTSSGSSAASAASGGTVGEFSRAVSAPAVNTNLMSFTGSMD